VQILQRHKPPGPDDPAGFRSLRYPQALACHHDAIAAGGEIDLLGHDAGHMEGQEVEEHPDVGLVGKRFPDRPVSRAESREEERRHR
jgi:hypothetical protein